jgi:hypothetical protein
VNIAMLITYRRNCFSSSRSDICRYRAVGIAFLWGVVRSFGDANRDSTPTRGH